MKLFPIRFRRSFTLFCQFPYIIVPVIVLGIIMYFVSEGNITVTLQYMWIVAVTMFLCYLIGLFIKFLYFKERPEPREYKHWRDKIDASSFPSVHTAQATILLWFAVILSTAIETEIVLGVIFSAFYVMIAFSRVELKKHFIIDVISGTVYGLLIVALSMRQMNAIAGLGTLLFSR